jgi:hypothetical protein
MAANPLRRNMTVLPGRLFQKTYTGWSVPGRGAASGVAGEPAAASRLPDIPPYGGAL